MLDTNFIPRSAVKRADSPEQLHVLFAAALHARDVEALAVLYADAACLTPRTGGCARGIAAVRDLLAHYCAMNATMQIKTREAITVGDTALLMSDWHMTGTGPDRSPIDAAGTSVEVARRGADGAWRYLIDLPHGVAG